MGSDFRQTDNDECCRQPLRNRWGLSVVLASNGRRVGRPRGRVEQGVVDPSTREMGRLLAELASKIDPRTMPFQVEDRRAGSVGGGTHLATSHHRATSAARFSYAYALLGAGRTADCLAAIDDAEGGHRQECAGALGHRPSRWSSRLQATAYLRLAEELNCHLANNRDSCLLPIRGEGVHQKREGGHASHRGVEGHSRSRPRQPPGKMAAERGPHDARELPRRRPKRDLIPPAVFASEYPLPAFENVAQQVGVDAYGLAGGAILDDFDNDGRLDLMVSHSGFEEQTRFFHNRGDGTFEDRTERAGLAGEMGGLNMVQADYDNDGLVDVLVLRGGWMGPT